MTLVRNLLLFFVLFLPASCAVGVASGLLSGPIPAPRTGYAIMTFFVDVLPLLVPSLLAVPVLHFGCRRWLRSKPPARARWIVIGLTPIALLAVHLAVYADRYWGLPLLALVVLPGALYGAAFGLVRPASGDASEPAT